MSDEKSKYLCSRTGGNTYFIQFIINKINFLHVYLTRLTIASNKTFVKEKHCNEQYWPNGDLTKTQPNYKAPYKLRKVKLY